MDRRRENGQARNRQTQWTGMYGRREWTGWEKIDRMDTHKTDRTELTAGQREVRQDRTDWHQTDRQTKQTVQYRRGKAKEGLAWMRSSLAVTIDPNGGADSSITSLAAVGGCWRLGGARDACQVRVMREALRLLIRKLPPAVRHHLFLAVMVWF